jgi:hypothetical protein
MRQIPTSPQLLVTAALLLGCVQPNAGGARGGVQTLPTDAGVGRDLTGPTDTGSPAESDAATAEAPQPRPDVSPPPDVAAPPDAALPEAPANLPRDASSADAPGDTEPEPPAEPCQGEVRGCTADQSSTRRCQAGRWVFERTCSEGTCSAGDCVCRPGQCQESVLVRSAGGLNNLAIAGDQLHYVRSILDVSLAGLFRLDLRTNETATTVPDGPASQNIFISVAPGPMGLPTWCRGVSGTRSAAIMRGAQLLEAVACERLAGDGSHVYFTRQDRDGLFRRALASPGRQTITDVPPLSFEVVGPHLYFAAVDDTTGLDTTTTSVHRVRVDGGQPGPPQRVGLAVTPQDFSFYEIAVDDRYVYAVDGDSLLWAALPPEESAPNTFHRFWNGAGPIVTAVAVGPHHAYWTTETGGVRGCTAATVWRKPKMVDAPAQAIATYPGSCPGELLFHDGYLHVVITSVTGGAQIVRLRP